MKSPFPKRSLRNKPKPKEKKTPENAKPIILSIDRSISTPAEELPGFKFIYFESGSADPSDPADPADPEGPFSPLSSLLCIA